MHHAMHQIRGLTKLGIRNAFSLVSDGNMSFRYGDKNEVIENRKKFLKKLDLEPTDCVSMFVRDRADIQIVGAEHKSRGMLQNNQIEADCLITLERGVFLWLVVADCLPAVFFHKEPFILGLAHLGWKSSGFGLAERVAEKFKELGADPRKIFVGIGPSIRKESYLLKNPEQKDKEGWRKFILPTENGLFSVDLVGFNKAKLLSAGILKEHIFVSSVDTAQSLDFYSHYRARQNHKFDREARFAAVAGVRK